jgi:hypothetical protein
MFTKLLSREEQIFYEISEIMYLLKLVSFYKFYKYKTT